jgi:hypothetical protein
MACVSCPECKGEVSERVLECVHCGYFEPEGTYRPRAAAVGHRTGGYLLEAATLFLLFKMTMPEGMRPSWSASVLICLGLVLAGAGVHFAAERVGRRLRAGRWGRRRG